MPILTSTQIESAIDSLSIQSRTMLHLLFLQFLEVTQDEIEYMAQDQPDSRFQAGRQPKEKASPLDGTKEISARMAQYHGYLRQKRERPWLQVKCLQQQITQTELIISVTERLLTSKCDVDSSILQERQKQASSAIPKPAIRQLEKAFDQGTITEEEFRKERLLIEYQTLHRRLIRQKRHLMSSKRDFQLAGASILQDHEIAHIWGIPLGSLASRKVKALQQYLTLLQRILQETQSSPQSEPDSTPSQSPDLWKETLVVLNSRRVERSIVSYGGLEHSEEQLMEKLKEFAFGTLSEEAESKFWADITRPIDTEHSGAWGSHARSIFALQRLLAIQAELDTTSEEIEKMLIGLATPKSLADALPTPEGEEQPIELSEQGVGVLHALIGEQDGKRRT